MLRGNLYLNLTMMMKMIAWIIPKKIIGKIKNYLVLKNEGAISS